MFGHSTFLQLVTIGAMFIFFMIHIQFLLHCEGTRFTEKKHKISMEVAEKKGLPKLKYHLLPRTKGFCVTVQNLRGKGEIFTCHHLSKSLKICDV